VHRVPLSTANDWLRHPKLLRPVPWRTTSGEGHIEFEADVDGARWSIRMNDFPDEPLYTVLVDGDEVMHFDDWPSIWTRPEFPKNERTQKDVVQP
jgi:hypothetical protein